MPSSSATLENETKRIVSEFKLPGGYLQKAVDEYISQASRDLAKSSERGMSMIPTFVSRVPTGKETGTFLAIDLGGTNFRVCSVQLRGDSTYHIIADEDKIPTEMMTADLKSFVNFLVDNVENFLNNKHSDFLDECKESYSHEKRMKMGFTFSFPQKQTSINRGTLIRWTKGFDIDEAVGKDIALELQNEFDKRKVPVYISAVVNDTVGTLVTRAYTKPENSGQTVLGCIFGTGTNGAYLVPISHIKKFDAKAHNVTDNEMVVNTEWGSFDNDLKILPNNKYDAELNDNTPNKDFHMFEKRISGMFLGELLRLCILDLYKQELVFTNNESAKQKLDNKEHALFTPWSMNTMFPAVLHGDDSEDMKESIDLLKDCFGFSPTLEEVEAFKEISVAIGTRSAYLSAIPIAGAITQLNALEKYDKVDVGADGSVVERYPGFQKMIKEGLAKTKLGSKGADRITIGIAKDGSGVGAALCALIAP